MSKRRLDHYAPDAASTAGRSAAIRSSGASGTLEADLEPGPRRLIRCTRLARRTKAVVRPATCAREIDAFPNGRKARLGVRRHRESVISSSRRLPSGPAIVAKVSALPGEPVLERCANPAVSPRRAGLVFSRPAAGRSRLSRRRRQRASSTSILASPSEGALIEQQRRLEPSCGGPPDARRAAPP